MAYTPERLAEGRHELAYEFSTNSLPNNRIKAIYNAAFDALDTWFAGVKASGSTAIDNAIAPATLTNAQKLKLFKVWLNLKFKTE